MKHAHSAALSVLLLPGDVRGLFSFLSQASSVDCLPLVSPIDVKNQAKRIRSCDFLLCPYPLPSPAAHTMIRQVRAENPSVYCLLLCHLSRDAVQCCAALGFDDYFDLAASHEALLCHLHMVQEQRMHGFLFRTLPQQEHLDFRSGSYVVAACQPAAVLDFPSLGIRPAGPSFSRLPTMHYGARYQMQGSRLILRSLQLWEPYGFFPPLGKTPPRIHRSHLLYAPLSLPIPYSGTIIAKSPAPSKKSSGLPGHLFGCKQLLELTLQSGSLVCVKDRSPLCRSISFFQRTSFLLRHQKRLSPLKQQFVLDHFRPAPWEFDAYFYYQLYFRAWDNRVGGGH